MVLAPTLDGHSGLALCLGWWLSSHTHLLSSVGDAHTLRSQTLVGPLQEVEV